MVAVGLGVGLGVGVAVGVAVRVADGVGVRVHVAVLVGVLVGVAVMVRVKLGVPQEGMNSTIRRTLSTSMTCRAPLPPPCTSFCRKTAILASPAQVQPPAGGGTVKVAVSQRLSKLLVMVTLGMAPVVQLLEATQ
jgi:hypothetical protein